MEELNVPTAVRPYADRIVAVTDALSGAVDVEYADLCRRVVGKLGLKRPAPLTRGDLGNRAAGVVYAVGQLNCVFDPAQTPHATADQLRGWLGGAGPHERSETRIAQRNGTRDKVVRTGVGDVTGKISETRTGSFFPALLAPVGGSTSRCTR